MLENELKSAIEAGNRAIEAIRTQVESIKGDDVLSKEKLGRMEASLAEAISAKAATESELKALSNRLEEMEAKANRPGAPGNKADDEYKSAFMALVRNPTDRKAEQTVLELQSKAVDVRTSALASGGYALPEIVSTEIARTAMDLSPIRQIARVVQVGSPDYKELIDRNGFGFEWVGETSTRNQTSTPNLVEIAPTFGEIAAKPEATRHALADLFFDVEGWLVDSAARMFAKAEGEAFILGDGVNKPTGFLNGAVSTDGDDARAFGTLQVVETGSAATIGTDPYDALYDLVFATKAEYRAAGRFVLNSLTLAQYAKVKDTNGQYLLQRAVAEGLPDRLMGYATTVAESMPDVAADATPIAFGDFQRGYLIADRAGMQLIRDEVTRPGFVRWCIFKRVGGILKDSDAIKLLRVSA